ncbi:hypothetical protein CYV19_13690 [Natronobacterium gregoryi SP2]|uniref:Uncharacterized protein n=1 Tax=Natronobacterium gregoryi (strain ATCC 43098 / DSM 3393 / CCM 3738 / CIP 104747 / IAM 13177 / JCM 8860 / NBRC 102187 / NCIMB 2189 / SP2) TaxID=797304 RepID=A0A2J4JCM7_NATGS|nr:hypothetical protein CYV19_13690 [Natronobacterium gregoryi SP2]
MTVGRSVVAVTAGDSRESATDFVLTSVQQYDPPPAMSNDRPGKNFDRGSSSKSLRALPPSTP